MPMRTGGEATAKETASSDQIQILVDRQQHGRVADHERAVSDEIPVYPVRMFRPRIAMK
jgi:hypothetical protein